MATSRQQRQKTPSKAPHSYLSGRSGESQNEHMNIIISAINFAFVTNEQTCATFLRYLRDVFRKAQQRPLEESDLYETLDEHKSAPISDNFSKLWEQQLSSGTKRPHLLKVINQAYGWKVLGFGFIFAVIETICR